MEALKYYVFRIQSPMFIKLFRCFAKMLAKRREKLRKNEARDVRQKIFKTKCGKSVVKIYGSTLQRSM